MQNTTFSDKREYMRWNEVGLANARANRVLCNALTVNCLIRILTYEIADTDCVSLITLKISEHRT